MESVEMTSQEIEILSAVYTDSERIREGRLFSHQLEALQQLRAGMQYLDEKYPGHKLNILTYAPATKFTPSAQFLLQGDGEETYTMTVSVTNDAYVCADSYYGTLIRDSYDKHVSELLTGGGFGAESFTTFSTPMGMEVNGDITVQEFISIEPKVSRNTHLFITETSDQDAAKTAIQALLEENGLYGSYILFFVPASEYGDVLTMEANRSSWNYLSFNCFNIR